MPHGSHCHHHHGHDPSQMNEKALFKAIFANVVLTLAQIAGGLVSGSLSLIADALHNLSDAASLFIAVIAIRIGRKPADTEKTFGYKRAETIAALINLTTLVAIGFYLLGQAVRRFFAPEPIEGWTVIVIAGIALIVDLYTAFLTYRAARSSMNMRAAFLHNLTDALASVGVIVAGALVLLKDWVIADTIMTIIIAGYVLYHGLKSMPAVIHLLMEGTPDDIEIAAVTRDMESLDGVEDVHHVHIWQIDENKRALEAHVQITEFADMARLKKHLKKMLADQHQIEHSTLEFETESEDCDMC